MGRSADAAGGKPLDTSSFPPFRLVDAIFRVIFLVRHGVSVHHTNFVNTVCPLLPEVPDKKVALMFYELWWLYF